jgi:hypothetical protein
MKCGELLRPYVLGIVDLLVAAVIVAISATIIGGISATGYGILLIGVVVAGTQAICLAFEKVKEVAISFGKKIINYVLGILGLDIDDIMRWITAAGFNGDAFEFTGSIDITPLDIGAMVKFESGSLPDTTLMVGWWCKLTLSF